MKILMIILAITFLFSNTFAYKSSVQKSGGGANGYDFVDEDHDTDAGTSALNCQSPGYSNCGWNDKPGDIHHA